MLLENATYTGNIYTASTLRASNEDHEGIILKIQSNQILFASDSLPNLA